jgi:hypothetical protein
MANDSDQIVEEIVLDLKTNWDSELRNTLRKMNQFKDQVADISKSAVNSYGNFQKQFLSEFGSMSKNTVGEMRVLIGATRRELGELQKINNDFLKAQSEASDQLERRRISALGNYTKKVREAYREQAVKKYEVKEAWEAGGRKGGILGPMKAINEGTKATLSKLRDEYDTTVTRIQKESLEPLYLKSVEVHAKTSATIASTAERSLRSVSATVKDILSQYDRVKNLIPFGGIEGKLLAKSEFLTSTKSQFKAADATLKANQARMDKLEDLRKTAEDMMMRARKEDAGAIENLIKKIVTEQMAIKNVMEGTAKQLMTLKDLIKVVTTDAIANGARIQQSLKAAVSPMNRDIGIAAKKSFENLAKMVSASATGDQKGYLEAAGNVKNYVRELDTAEIKLKQIQNQIKAVAGTGLIDEGVLKSLGQKIINDLNLIKQSKQELASAAKEFKSLDIHKMAQKADAGGFIKSATAFAKSQAEYSGLGPITPQNYLQADALIKKMQSSYDVFAKHKQTIDNQMAENEKAILNIRSVRSSTHDAGMVKSYTQAIELMIKENKRLADLKVIAATSPAMKPIDTQAQHAKVVAQAKQVAADIQKSVKPEGWLNAGVEGLQKDLIKLQETTAKLGKFSLFKDYKRDGIDMYESLKARAKAYTNEIANIGKQIVELKRIQKSGLGDSDSIGRTITQLTNMQKQFRYANQEIARINNQASKSHQTLVDSTSKGMLRSGMEMIRNFRWQYAAVYYIIQNIIGRVASFVKGTMDEVGQFQKDALSLAAVISMRMAGTIESNFDTAYQYSRGLMDKLQLVATETVLTLEDLTMLTKTFVQAGIIPNTVEDVRKISDIGVAIRAVTEGMANAGTQMRQELNAVILGRQRASDQLAMMFKFMGIDLRKTLKDAQDEGRNLLDVLSEVLKPFSAMNKAMQDNWLQASNRATEVWKIIKRIGAEDFTASMTDKLNKFLDTLIDAKGQLTALGREWAAAFGAVMTTLGSVGLSVLGTVKNIASIFSILVGSIKESTLNMDGLSGTLTTILETSRLLMWTFVVMKNVTSAIAASLALVMAYSPGSAATARAQVERENPKFKDRANLTSAEVDEREILVTKKLSDMKNKAWYAFHMASRTAEEDMEEIDKTLQKIVDKVKEGARETVDLGKIFKPPHDTIALMDFNKKLSDDLKSAQLASMKGPIKFKTEYEIDVTGLGLHKEQLEAQIKYYKNYIEELESSNIEYDAGQINRYNITLGALKDALKRDTDLRKYYGDKRDRQTADWYHTEGDRLARLAEEWEGFLISTAEAPMNEWQKLDKWIEETQKKMRKMKVTNTENYDPAAAQEALIKGTENRAKKISADSEKAQKDLMEKMSSYKFKSPFQQIDLEADKMRNDIDEFMRQFVTLDDHTNSMVEHWGEMVVEMGKAKRELAHLDLLQQNYNSKMDLASRQINYWKDAYDPATRRLANINSILVEQSKAVGEISIAYKKVDTQIKQMQKDGATEGIESYIEMRENYVKQLEIMKMETEKLIWKDLHPLWAELNEMSKSWGDGMTDAFADIIDGSKKAGVAINDLLKTVQRDVLKAVIKNTITEPIMGFMGGAGTPGEVSPVQKILGIKGEGAAGTMKKVMEGVKAENEKLMNKFLNGYTIIPVQIVGKTETLKSASEEANQSVVEMMKENNDLTKDGVDQQEVFMRDFQSYFDNLVSVLTTGSGITSGVKAIGDEGSLSNLVKGMVGKIGGLFGGGGGGAGGSGGNWFSSLFSSGGASTSPSTWASKTGDWAGQGGGNAAASGGGFWSGMGSWFSSLFGMAEGGTIKEPIVGQGLRSGSMYAFGEKTPYGQNEVVAPMDKLAKIAAGGPGSGQQISLSMPINVQAIDTQSGVDFLMKHNGTIENSMIKMVRNNRRIRDAFRAS